eukprot:7450654-Alexandrium_andersonii.AAC.1
MGIAGPAPPLRAALGRPCRATRRRRLRCWPARLLLRIGGCVMRSAAPRRAATDTPTRRGPEMRAAS